jgi:cytidylate kinase
MTKAVDLPNIRNITVSGRIASGATTLAKNLSKLLNWKLLEGGDLFEKIHKELKLDQSTVSARPDHFDLEYEERIKKMLRDESYNIIQSHLAGYDAQGIPGVFKILIVCEDEHGHDKREVRIDRLLNRDGVTLAEAKDEVVRREEEHLAKFRRLYAGGDPEWVYWKREYYDLKINTYDKTSEHTFRLALKALGLTPK